MSVQQLQNSKQSLTWVDITSPTDQDREALTTIANFTISDVNDAFRKTARSKIVKHEEYIYFVLTAPVYSQEHASIEVHELDVFIGKQFVVTVHHGEFPPVRDMFSRCGQLDSFKKEILAHGPEHLLYRIIDAVQDYTYPMIDHLNEELEALKKQIFGGTRRESAVQDILHVRQNITDMRTAMRSHASLISHMLRSDNNQEVLHIIKHQARFGELIDYANELWGALESSKEMVEALEDANEGMLSHALNHTMKRLTIVSVVLLPATILAGVFGMNTHPLPGISFAAACVVIGAVSLLIFFLFWSKGWLR